MLETVHMARLGIQAAPGDGPPGFVSGKPCLLLRGREQAWELTQEAPRAPIAPSRVMLNGPDPAGNSHVLSRR